MYVAGSPGLGKSMTVREAFRLLSAGEACAGEAADAPPPCKSCFVNGFQLQTPAAVYAALLAELGVDDDAVEAATGPRQALERFFVPAAAEEAEGRQAAAAAGARRRTRVSGASEAGGSAEADAGALVVADPVGGAGGAGGSMCLVVIDELDQLLSKENEALHSLFGWAAAPSSRLVLVGIANSLDLARGRLPTICSCSAVSSRRAPRGCQLARSARMSR